MGGIGSSRFSSDREKERKGERRTGRSDPLGLGREGKKGVREGEKGR